MTDKQVTLVATIWPAEGKLERLKEVMDAATNNLRQAEPGTLQFQVLEETDVESPRMVLDVSRYRNQAALDEHRSRPSYGAVFKTISDEGLMAKPPDMIVTEAVGGFK